MFTDNKKNTWQIINRKDINGGMDFNDQEVLAASEIEDKERKPIKGKNLMIDVDKIESEYNNGDLKEERVSIIENENSIHGNTDEKKEDQAD